MRRVVRLPTAVVACRSRGERGGPDGGLPGALEGCGPDSGSLQGVSVLGSSVLGGDVRGDGALDGGSVLLAVARSFLNLPNATATNAAAGDGTGL